MKELKKPAEERIRDLFTKRRTLPLEVIIPMLEKAGRSEQELIANIYSYSTSTGEEIKEILGLTEKNMRTLAKLWEIFCGIQGTRCQPNELTEARYSISMVNCPMLNVGKGIGFDVKSKFCDAVCAGASGGLMDVALGIGRGTCTIDKALIKGKGKCTLNFELVKDK